MVYLQNREWVNQPCSLPAIACQAAPRHITDVQSVNQRLLGHSGPQTGGILL